MILDDFEEGEFGEEYSSDPSFYFCDFLARGNFSMALDLFEKHDLEISPDNKYVSSVDDLASKAAFHYREKGMYEDAYISLLTYAPKKPLIKYFARTFAADMLSRLIEAYDDFEKEGSVDLIKELTYDLHCLERAHFPEGLMFERKSGSVSLSSIIDGHRICKLFENYFFHVESLNNKNPVIINMQVLSPT